MMDTSEEPPAQAVAAAENLLKHVDLERLGGYASAAAATIVLVRRHPWLLIAAGATAAAVGTWQLSRNNRKQDKKKAAQLDRIRESENGRRS